MTMSRTCELTFDLHGLRRNEAETCILHILSTIPWGVCGHEVTMVTFIPGRGNNSYDGPVLKPMVIELCHNQLGYKLDRNQRNSGRVTILIDESHQTTRREFARIKFNERPRRQEMMKLTNIQSELSIHVDNLSTTQGKYVAQNILASSIPRILCGTSIIRVNFTSRLYKLNPIMRTSILRHVEFLGYQATDSYGIVSVDITTPPKSKPSKGSNTPWSSIQLD